MIGSLGLDGAGRIAEDAHLACDTVYYNATTSRFEKSIDN